MLADKETGRWIVAAVIVAGVFGACLGGHRRVLRDRFNANEILVSLMLVYVATRCSAIWSTGRGTDAGRLQLPADDHVPEVDADPEAVHRLSVNIGPGDRLLAVGACWSCCSHLPGFQLQGRRASRGGGALCGFSSRRALWLALLLSGGMAAWPAGSRSPGRSAS